MYKRFGLSGLAVLGLMAGVTAQAEVQPGFYAGAGVGQSSIHTDELDDSDTSFKVFGGYTFNEFLGVELAYFDGGSIEASIPSIFNDASIEAEVAGFTTAAVGRLPLSETFAVYGKLGLALSDAEVTVRYTGSPNFPGGSFSTKESSEDVMYGIGAAFDFGRFEVRGEYEVFDVSDGDFSMLSLTGFFRF
ncbi:MAG TPA: porin family protein [Steroidobacter sp.]|nr:porin family protein [Steroidobacter sp.]